MIDRVKVELLPPLLSAELRQEAHRWRRAGSATPRGAWWVSPVVGLGALFIRAGQRLIAVECRRTAPARLGFAIQGCGCGE